MKFKYIKIAIIILCFLLLSHYDTNAASKIYGATSLTGGGTGALDKLDGIGLNSGDIAIVVTTASNYFYTLKTSGCGVENPPDTIIPDTNAGTKCWVITTAVAGGLPATISYLGSSIQDPEVDDDITLTNITQITNRSHSLLTSLDYASAGHTGFEPTVTKGNLTAGSTKVSIGGTGTGALIGAGASIDITEANLTLSNIGGSVTDVQVPDTITLDNITQITTRSHSDLQNLAADSHSNYALLVGRSTPQLFAFGSAASAATGYLTSTSNATKGKYFLNSARTITVNELDVRLGIGTANPSYLLDVNGTTRIGTLNGIIKGTTGVLSAITDSSANWDTAYTHSQDNTQAHSDYLLNTGDTGTGDYVFDGAAIFNEAGADKDFRIEGDTNANLFFVDASTDRVGIGTASPDTTLDVRGTTKLVTTPMAYVIDLWGDLILLGSDVDKNTRAGNFPKIARILAPTYAYDGGANNNIMTLFYPFSNSTSNNVYFGGGTSQGIAATDIYFNTQTSLTAFSAGTKRMHITKDGDVEIPQDTRGLVLGAGQDAKIYYDGTNLIIDPNVVGTGKVYIGATGNDTINAGAYEVGGVAGLNQTISVRKGDDTGACTITITNGIITATTC